MTGRIRCVYEVLGLDQSCSDDDIKRAYKKAALKWHPDKNLDNPEEAEKQFKEVTRAFSVLSDPQERAWYDAHRDSILRGGDGTAGGDADDDDAKDDGLDLFQFFTETCFDGFSCDSGGKDFFTVFENVFATLANEEREGSDDNNDQGVDDLPPFGAEHTKWDQVANFYSFWGGFGSRRTFAWADKWYLPDAPNRHVRRLMEKDNKKHRDAARKTRNEEVRALVEWVKKRDPRVKARKVEQRERAIKQEQQRAIKEQQDRELHAQRKREWQARRTEELRAEEEAIRSGEMEQADAWLDEDLHSRRSKNKINNNSNNNNSSNNNDGDDYSEEDVIMLHCVACNKYFKSDRQLANHQTSKKHRQRVEQLARKLEAEDEVVRQEASRVGAGVEDNDNGHCRPCNDNVDDNSSNKEAAVGGDSDSDEIQVVRRARVPTQEGNEGVDADGGSGSGGEEGEGEEGGVGGLAAGLEGLAPHMWDSEDVKPVQLSKKDKKKKKKKKNRGGGQNQDAVFLSEEPEEERDSGVSFSPAPDEVPAESLDQASRAGRKGKKKKNKKKGRAAGYADTFTPAGLDEEDLEGGAEGQVPRPAGGDDEEEDEHTVVTPGGGGGGGDQGEEEYTIITPGGGGGGGADEGGAVVGAGENGDDDNDDDGDFGEYVSRNKKKKGKKKGKGNKSANARHATSSAARGRPAVKAGGGHGRESKQPQQSRTVCNVCNQVFTSRSKLFAHIQETGHALQA